MRKQNDYYYKNACLNQQNEYERILFEYDNPYGYRFESCRARKIDYESLVYSPRNIVNPELLNKKR